jgi:hypothetical protein
MKKPVLIEKSALQPSMIGAFLLAIWGGHYGGHIRLRRHGMFNPK